MRANASTIFNMQKIQHWLLQGEWKFYGRFIILILLHSFHSLKWYCWFTCFYHQSAQSKKPKSHIKAKPKLAHHRRCHQRLHTAQLDRCSVLGQHADVLLMCSTAFDAPAYSHCHHELHVRRLFMSWVFTPAYFFVGYSHIYSFPWGSFMYKNLYTASFV